MTQVVPNWNDPTYLNGFEQLLAALGRRYDGDERLSVFEFSGYGDFSENHIAYPRDTAGAPGAEPDDSVATLGYYSQFRDQSITIASIRQLVAANVNAFPRTQLVVTPQNPEIVRELFADDVTKKLSAPVGIRSDCLGVQAPLPAWADSNDSHYVRSNDAVVNAIKQRLASALVITEWCGLPKGTDPQSYYQKGLHDVVRYHVSMTSSAKFPDRDSTSAMDPKLYLIWAQANSSAGYRYSVETQPGSQSMQGKHSDHSCRLDQLRLGSRHRKLGIRVQAGGLLGSGGSRAARNGQTQDAGSRRPKRPLTRGGGPGVVNRVGSYRPHGLGAGALHAARVRGMATAQAGRLTRGELRAHVVGPRRP